MTEKDSNFEIANSISHNFAQSTSVGSPTSKQNVQIPSSNSTEAQPVQYNEETIHKVNISSRKKNKKSNIY